MSADLKLRSSSGYTGNKLSGCLDDRAPCGDPGLSRLQQAEAITILDTGLNCKKTVARSQCDAQRVNYLVSHGWYRKACRNSFLPQAFRLSHWVFTCLQKNREHLIFCPSITNSLACEAGKVSILFTHIFV